jgi:hypothetical protein
MVQSESDFRLAIKPWAGTIVKLQYAPDAEAHRLAEDLKYMLTGAGWKAEYVSGSESNFDSADINKGVTLYIPLYPPAAKDGDRQAAELLRDTLGQQIAVDSTIVGMPPRVGVKGPNLVSNAALDVPFVFVAVGARPFTKELSDMKASCN